MDSTRAPGATHSEVDAQPDSASALVRFASIQNREDTAPRNHQWSPDQFTEMLRRHACEYNGKDGPAIIGALFDRKGKRRGYRDSPGEHVACATMIALDFDQLPDDLVQEVLDALPFYGWSYTTPSHGDPEARGEPSKANPRGRRKWLPGTTNMRLVFPLAADLVPGEDALWDVAAQVAACAELLAEMCDPSGKLRESKALDLSATRVNKLFYTPRRPRAGVRAPEIEHRDSFDRFDPWAFGLEEHQRAAEERAAQECAEHTAKTPEGAPWLGGALEYLDAENRDLWVYVGHALKNSFGDAGFGSWFEWGSSAAGADDEAEHWRRWNGFTRRKVGRVVTIGSIWLKAKQQGWVPPLRHAFDPFEGAERVPLAEARVRVREELERAWADTGATLLGADTETGKSSALLEHVLARFEDAHRRGEQLPPIVLAFPTDALVLEKQQDLLARADRRWGESRPDLYNAFEEHLRYDGGRRPDEAHPLRQGEEHPFYCAEYEHDYRPRERALAASGASWCRSGQCPLHVRNEHRVASRRRACPASMLFVDDLEPNDVILRTHAMHMRREAESSPGVSSRRSVRWAQILDTFGYAFADGELEGPHEGTFEPFLKATRSGLHLLAREAAGGQPAPVLEEGVDVRPEDPDRPGGVRLTARGRRAILSWSVDVRSPAVGLDPLDPAIPREDPRRFANLIELMCDASEMPELPDEALSYLWHVFDEPDDFELDAVVFDEDPSSAALPEARVLWDAEGSATSLCAVVRAGYVVDALTGDAVGVDDPRIVRALAWRDERRAKDAEEAGRPTRRSFTLEEIGGRLPDFSTLEVELERFERAQDVRLKAGKDPKEMLEHEAVKALARLFEGTARASADGGGLTIATGQPVAVPWARSTLLLDATMDEHTARALCPGAEVVQVRAQRHPGSRVYRADVTLGSTEDLSEPSGAGWQFAEVGPKVQRYATFHEDHGQGAPVVHLVRRAQSPDRCEPGGSWATERLRGRQACGDAVIHHNGPQARGSNEYEGYACIIVDPWHVPTSAVMLRASVLSALACASGSLAPSEGWEAVARWSMEGAPVLQGAERVRSRGNPRTIIYAASKDIPGLSPTEITNGDGPGGGGSGRNLHISIDARASLRAGRLPRHGKGVASALLADALDARGGYLKVEPEFAGALDELPDEEPTGPYSGVYAAIEALPAETRRDLERDMSAKLKPLWRRNKGKLAELVGFRSWRPRTSLGGKRSPWYLLSVDSGGVPRDVVIDDAREAGATWVEFEGGERVVLRQSVFSADLRGALLQFGEPPTWTRLAEALGLSATTAKRRSKLECGIAGKSDLDRLWSELARPSPDVDSHAPTPESRSKAAPAPPCAFDDTASGSPAKPRAPELGAPPQERFALERARWELRREYDGASEQWDLMCHLEDARASVASRWPDFDAWLVRRDAGCRPVDDCEGLPELLVDLARPDLPLYEAPPEELLEQPVEAPVVDFPIDPPAVPWERAPEVEVGGGVSVADAEVMAAAEDLEVQLAETHEMGSCLAEAELTEGGIVVPFDLVRRGALRVASWEREAFFASRTLPPRVWHDLELDYWHSGWGVSPSEPPRGSTVAGNPFTLTFFEVCEAFEESWSRAPINPLNMVDRLTMVYVDYRATGYDQYPSLEVTRDDAARVVGKSVFDVFDETAMLWGYIQAMRVLMLAQEVKGPRRVQWYLDGAPDHAPLYGHYLPEVITPLSDDRPADTMGSLTRERLWSPYSEPLAPTGCPWTPSDLRRFAEGYACTYWPLWPSEGESPLTCEFFANGFGRLRDHEERAWEPLNPVAFIEGLSLFVMDMDGCAGDGWSVSIEWEDVARGYAGRAALEELDEPAIVEAFTRIARIAAGRAGRHGRRLYTDWWSAGSEMPLRGVHLPGAEEIFPWMRSESATT